MTVIFRPHCRKCGYEFEEIHGTTAKELPFGPVFEPYCCPQCKEPIKRIVYFTTTCDKESFDYTKESADNYAKELEDADNQK